MFPLCVETKSPSSGQYRLHQHLVHKEHSTPQMLSDCLKSHSLTQVSQGQMYIIPEHCNVLYQNLVESQEIFHDFGNLLKCGDCILVSNIFLHSWEEKVVQGEAYGSCNNSSNCLLHASVVHCASFDLHLGQLVPRRHHKIQHSLI